MNRRKRTLKRAIFKRCGAAILALAIATAAILLLTSFVKYPEQYISTWRYQLQCDIENGDKAAIEYYETNYLANGINLFE